MTTQAPPVPEDEGDALDLEIRYSKDANGVLKLRLRMPDGSHLKLRLVEPEDVDTLYLALPSALEAVSEALEVSRG